MFIEDTDLIHLHTRHQEPESNILPVIMCTWKREDGFSRVIDHLNKQDFKSFHLYVWNNNQELSDSFQRILNERAEFPCSIFHSKENIGGFGRFYLARHILKMGISNNFCVFIDDDQTFENNSLSVFTKEARTGEISSQWAWKLKTLEYYGAANRINVPGGQEVDYCGTGGMVCDLNIFSEDKLFECPKKFWFIEDLWLSFYANHYKGYVLRKSSAKFKNGSDQHNLFEKIKHLKSPMLKELVEEYNWEITYTKLKNK